VSLYIMNFLDDFFLKLKKLLVKSKHGIFITFKTNLDKFWMKFLDGLDLSVVHPYLVPIKLTSLRTTLGTCWV
jgi:hypothetical protein